MRRILASLYAIGDSKTRLPFVCRAGTRRGRVQRVFGAHGDCWLCRVVNGPVQRRCSITFDWRTTAVGAQSGHWLKLLVHRLSYPAIGKQRFRNNWYRDLADRRCQDSAILPSPLRAHANCAIGGDAPHQPAPKFRPRIQGGYFKDERICASSSARALRAASA
jgi:hypothetical protein